MNKYKCTVTPRQNIKSENKVKRRCFVVMSDSKGGASTLAVEKMTNEGIARSQYKLDIELFDEKLTDHIVNTDGELLEVSQEFQKQEKPKKPVKTSQKSKQSPTNKVKATYDYTRSFCLISYIDTNVLEEWISQQSWVQHWAIALHDKDLNQDGTPKEVHSHVLLYTFSLKTSSAIKKRFDKFSAVYYHKLGQEPQNTLSQECDSMSMMWRYLTHMDDPDKYQYPKSIRRCDNFSYWLKLENNFDKTCAKENIALAIVNDLLDGVSTMELLERYGREYAIYRARYQEVARDHIRENDRIRCHDSLDLVTLCLESKYTKDQVYLWLEMLYYVRSECLMEYGQRVDVITDGAYIETADLKTITEMEH